MECNTVKKSLGIGNCAKLPQLIKGMITTPMNFYFTAAQAADADLMEAALQAAIIDDRPDRVFVWPYFDSMEILSEATVYQDTPLSFRKVRDGNYRFKFGISQGLCLHKKMFSHNSNTGRVFLFDNENQLTGTVDSDGNFKGFTIQQLNVEKIKFNDGSVVSESPVYVGLRDNKELDESGGIVDASFFNTVNRLTDVLLTIAFADTNDIHVAVTIECDGSPVNGLVLADFILLDDSGNAQTISTATESGDGIYYLHKSSGSWSNGTLSLADPADLSVVATLALQSYATDVIINS